MPASIASAIAANRFGLGARPGELALIGGESHEWLRVNSLHDHIVFITRGGKTLFDIHGSKEGKWVIDVPKDVEPTDAAAQFIQALRVTLNEGSGQEKGQ